MKIGAGIAAVGLLGVLLGKLASAVSPTPRMPRTPRITPQRLAEFEAAFKADRIAVNQKNGARLERATGRMLAELHPDSEIHEQVHVTDAKGRRHIIDHLVVDSDGTMTPAESKNVGKAQGKHLQQLEAQRAALEDNGVPTGDPILAVRLHTKIAEDLSARARILRVPMKRSQA